MMYMNGIFKFYQDGKLIGEAQNNITEVGRRLAIKTLMGAVPSFGNSLSIGTGETANTIVSGLATNFALDFRVASAKVSSSYLSNIPDYDAIVFKARIEDPLSYRIKEVGLFADTLYSGNTNYKTETLLAFEESDNWVNNSGVSLPTTGEVTRLISISEGAVNSGNFRIGDRALQVLTTTPATSDNTYSGLDSFANTDLIKLAFYAVAAGSVDVSFYTGTSYSTFRFTAASSGYKVVSVLKGSTPQAVSGTIDWSNITKIVISAVTSTMVVDGLRFERAYVPDSNTGMISRAVVPTALEKLSNTPLDIEYYLRLGFNV